MVLIKIVRGYPYDFDRFQKCSKDKGFLNTFEHPNRGQFDGLKVLRNPLHFGHFRNQSKSQIQLKISDSDPDRSNLLYYLYYLYYFTFLSSKLC